MDKNNLRNNRMWLAHRAMSCGLPSDVAYRATDAFIAECCSPDEKDRILSYNVACISLTEHAAIWERLKQYIMTH